MYRRNAIFLGIYLLLAIFTLFSGCTSGNQKHEVTLHFIDDKGHPVVDIPVEAPDKDRNNYGKTDSDGNVVFQMYGDNNYEIEVVYDEYHSTRTVYPKENYYTFTLKPPPFPRCNIESQSSTDINGKWTFNGFANNTGTSGTCKITVELFVGDIISGNYEHVPVDTKTETLYIPSGGNKSFSINVNDPKNTASSFSISIEAVY